VDGLTDVLQMTNRGTCGLRRLQRTGCAEVEDQLPVAAVEVLLCAQNPPTVWHRLQAVSQPAAALQTPDVMKSNRPSWRMWLRRRSTEVCCTACRVGVLSAWKRSAFRVWLPVTRSEDVINEHVDFDTMCNIDSFNDILCTYIRLLIGQRDNVDKCPCWCNCNMLVFCSVSQGVWGWKDTVE